MEWITAVSNGDIKRVEELMNNRYDVNVTDHLGNNALHLATDPDILSYLLGTSCDINARNAEGDTPLKLLVQNEPKSYKVHVEFRQN